MGRVTRREVIAIRCELRSCSAEVPVLPTLPVESTWHDQCDQLHDLVETGWAFVLNPRLRSFCPAHADRVQGCTCARHPGRDHLCTIHSDDAAALIWDQASIPEDVTRFREGAPS